MSNYYLNDPIFFLHYQIQVYSVQAWLLASGYKSAFFMLHVHEFMVFHNHARIQIIERSVGECIWTEKSEFAT